MENQLLDSDLLENKEGKSLSDILNNGYETHAVDYIKKGFDIFKQNAFPFIGFLLLIGLLEAIVSMVPFVKILAGALIAPIVAGGFIVAKKIDKNEPYDFSSFFEGTKNYIPLFLVTLLPTLLIAVIFLVVGGWSYFKMTFLGFKPSYDVNDITAMMNEARGYAGRAGLAGIISMVVSVLFLLGTFLVMFEKFEPINALDVSRKIISKKFFNWLGFLFLIGLFNMVGVICLFVGLFVTIPTSLCAMYVAYNDVVGMDLKD